MTVEEEEADDDDDRDDDANDEDDDDARDGGETGDGSDVDPTKSALGDMLRKRGVRFSEPPIGEATIEEA